jgi:hypothetical protein
VQPEPPSLPVIDGKYQLVRKLGEGGMGAVYEARHRGTGRRVAVKLIVTESLAKNAEVVGRFQREAMAAGAIESQYIAQVFDTGVDPATGHPYTVMELLVGEDLQQLVQRLGPLPPELALRVAAQACLGLRKAHEVGVVHRDIKPANIFLADREDGDVLVKLLDFGIAKVKQDQLSVSGNAGLTRTGTMLGSPLYMSPEQARGKKELDHRTDIWSLGIVLYEALTGTTPHAHLEMLGELIIQICGTPPRHVQELAPWIAPEVAAVVHRALALDPAQRFASAGEMFDALQARLPGGYALRKTQIVALPGEVRAVAASKLDLTSGMRAPSPSFAGLPRVDGPSGVAGAGTMPGVVNTRPSERAGRHRALIVSIPIALVMAAVGAIGAARLAATHRTPETAMTTPSVSPAPSPPVPAASLAPIAAPVDRSVRVVVLPPSARAQLDGVDAPVLDGTVAITGALGSVHHVHLSAGHDEVTTDVTIAEDGPMPPKVEVVVTPVKPVAAGPAPVTPRPAATPTTTAAPGIHMEMK